MMGEGKGRQMRWGGNERGKRRGRGRPGERESQRERGVGEDR